jgi:lipopolysaccharide export system permease protein
VKIINRYVLKEHLGPFVFALSALTSLMLLQYVARKFGDLVGKGLAWQTITEFFLLSFPFTMAMTFPMAVLVAVLYAFSRLASENEITALKAGGISSRSLLRPTLGAAVLLSIFMLWFNDQLLSRANHELATLQLAIMRTKPTFALKPQVINTVKESQLYLSAEQIDQDESGRMRGVTIYDVSDASKRKSIYADHGTLSFAPNRRDLILHLYKGMIMSAPTDRPGQLSRIYYNEDRLAVRDVANSFQSINADTSSKTEREMNVCEMQDEYEKRSRALERALIDSQLVVWRTASARGKQLPKPAEGPLHEAGGIGKIYCTFITKYLHVPAAQAAELPPRLRQDTTKRVPQDTTKRAAQDTTKRPAQDTTKRAAQDTTKRPLKDTTNASAVPASAVPPSAVPPGAVPASASPSSAVPVGAVPASAVPPPRSFVPVPPASNPQNPTVNPPSVMQSPAVLELNEADVRIDDARHWRNRYAVEIQKKFSLAFSCIVFVLVGAPIALRFPRGGVGLVMGVGFSVFAIYYVGLIGGEELANKNIVSPFWAMWVDNIIFLIVGLVLVARMGNEATTGRGGNFGEVVDNVRAWFQRRRGARA